MADNRLIADKYSYFVRGRQLIIIEHLQSEPTDPEEPSYTAPSETLSADPDSGSLMLEYTSVPDTSGMIDESDDLPVDEVLAKAIVDFCKAEMSEDPQTKEYYMQRFNKRVVRYTEGRVGGLRRVIGTGMMR